MPHPDPIAPQAATAQAPPSRNPDVDSLTQKWLGYLGTPESQAALVQFGSSILASPEMPFGVSLGRSIQEAAGAVGRVKENQISAEERVQTQENVVAEREATAARADLQSRTSLDVAGIAAGSRESAAEIGAKSRIDAAKIVTARQQGFTENEIVAAAIDLQETSGLDDKQLPLDTAVDMVLRAQQRIRQAGETGVQSEGQSQQAALDEAVRIATAPQVAESILIGDITIEQATTILTDDPQKLAQVQAILRTNESVGLQGLRIGTEPKAPGTR